MNIHLIEMIADQCDLMTQINLQQTNKNICSVVRVKVIEKDELLYFDNGVYDLDHDIFIYLKHNNRSVGFDYRPNYCETMAANINKFFMDIMPDEKEREYLLLCLASCLSRKRDDLFYIFHGDGPNGKSVLKLLLKITFGEYFCDFCFIESVTNYMLSMPSRRISFMYEGIRPIPPIGVIECTDEDICFTCKSDITNLNNKFKLIIISDSTNISHIFNNNSYINKYGRYINFPVKFVHNPLEKNEKKIDVYMYKKIKDWKQDFMLLLLKYYQKYRKLGYNVDRIKE